MSTATTRLDRSKGARLTLDRLNCLSDGVIAIVLTLLVLGVDIPEHHDFSAEGLVSFLAKVEYQVVVYAVSFVLIGSYWMQHNVMFHFFRNGSRGLTWLNLLFLFEVTLLPFTTKLIGTYKYEPLPILERPVASLACSRVEHEPRAQIKTVRGGV